MADQQMTTFRENVATPATLPLSEMQIRLAQDKPRNPPQCLANAIKELSAFPEFAEECWYSIPFKDNRKKRIAFVEGLSIGAAQMLKSHWGNTIAGKRVADDRGDKVIVQGLFFDIERNNMELNDLEVSKYNKGQNAHRLSDDALKKAVAAGESKAERNAILASLPVAVREGFKRAVKHLILNPKGGTSPKPYKERIAEAKAYFVRVYKVKPEAVETMIAKTLEEDPQITEADLLLYLIGVKNALREEAATVDYVFGEVRGAAQMPREKAPAPAAVAEGPAQTSTEEQSQVPASEGGDLGDMNPPGDAQEPA